MSQVAGSAIGDVSGVFTTQALTAVERHTAGGTVDITATGSGAGTAGDIVVMQGAAINFSGGGITYGAGALNTTMLVSGKKVYNISAAPTDITYDRILNTQTFASPKFGVTTEYDGVYCGGAFPVNAHSGSYTVGSNAGTLSLQAGTVVLDGTILGLVTNGIQQVLTVDPTNSTGNQSEYGYTEAEGGTLLIGGGVGSTSGSGNSGDTADFAVRSITVSPLTSPILFGRLSAGRPSALRHDGPFCGHPEPRGPQRPEPLCQYNHHGAGGQPDHPEPGRHFPGHGAKDRELRGDHGPGREHKPLAANGHDLEPHSRRQWQSDQSTVHPSQ